MRLAPFLRLTRPFFLLGGIGLYALGSAVAARRGFTLDWGRYALGQWAVTSFQLMTQYLNEYWDQETDRRNLRRTPFSGGSGVLAAGLLAPSVARRAGMTAAASGVVAFAVMAFTGMPAAALVVVAVAAAGSWAYSAPAVSLAGSGIGELIAAAIVSVAVPALAESIQTGRPSSELLAICVPLLLVNWSMLTAFAIPDAAADAAAGKRTVVVRLGRGPAVALGAAAMLVGYAVLALLPVTGAPRSTWLMLTAFPLAVAHLVDLARTDRWTRLAATAVGHYALLVGLAFVAQLIA